MNLCKVVVVQGNRLNGNLLLVIISITFQSSFSPLSDCRFRDFESLLLHLTSNIPVVV